ncbi:hypothetical protein Tco_0632595 [Tanacetum coccineum]
MLCSVVTIYNCQPLHDFIGDISSQCEHVRLLCGVFADLVSSGRWGMSALSGKLKRSDVGVLFGITECRALSEVVWLSGGVNRIEYLVSDIGCVWHGKGLEAQMDVQNSVGGGADGEGCGGLLRWRRVVELGIEVRDMNEVGFSRSDVDIGHGGGGVVWYSVGCFTVQVVISDGVLTRGGIVVVGGVVVRGGVVEVMSCGRWMVKMDDPNITIEEYIRLEEEKACRRAIVFNDTLTSEAALSCEPTANFEKEFLAIVYNDALTSKLDFLTEPTISIQHIDEFNLKDETSLSECDEEEQNVICFNDLFPFKLIYPDDSKSNKDNNDDKIDMIQSSGNFFVKPLPDVSIRHIMGNGYGVSTSCTVLGPCEGKSTNVGEEFTNLEILKCWSLENSMRYGYMKNHMKTVKNGQTRTQERKSEQKPEAKARKSQIYSQLQSILVNRRVIKSIHGIVNKMAGSNGSNQSISLAPKHQSHVAMEKAQRNEEFALHSLSKLAQAVTS